MPLDRIVLAIDGIKLTNGRLTIQPLVKCNQILEFIKYKNYKLGGRLSSVDTHGSTIQWPGFESQAQHICFLQFVIEL